MSIRSKMRRRMLTFTASVFGLVVVATTAYLIRERILENQSKEDLAAGLIALNQSAYETALNDIGIYVNRHPKDAESLFSYAKAREHVPMPQNQNLQDAMIRLRNVLVLSPGHVEATHELLNLYEMVNSSPEMQQLAESRLQADPTDKVAMRARVVALYRQGGKNYVAAFKQATDLVNLDPGDIDAQVMALEVCNYQINPTSSMQKYLKGLDAKKLGDVHYALLMSIGSKLLSEDTTDADARKTFLDNASASLKKAVAGTVSDVATAKMLVKQADTLGDFELSLELLSSKFNSIHNASLSVDLAQRLWQSDRFPDVVKQFPNLSATDSPDLLAMRYLSFKGLKQDKDADATLAILTDAKNKKLDGAAGWLNVLTVMYPSDPQSFSDKAVMDACRTGLNDQPSNGVFEMFLGDAYSRTGEIEAALQSWKNAAKDCPAWAGPLIHISQLLAQNGQWDDAGKLAQQASDRAPSNPQAQIALAITQAEILLKNRNTKDTQDAVTLINKVLDLKPPQETFIELAELSVGYKLGLEDGYLQKSKDTYGMTPEWALAKATIEVQRGHGDAGKKIMADAQAGAKSNDSASWKLANAHYLDITAADPALTDQARQPLLDQARLKWVEIYKYYPKNAMIQWQAARAPSMQGNREGIGAILTNLETISPGLALTMAKAKYFLDGNPKKDDPELIQKTRELRDLVRSAPDVIQLRLMLANCDELLGNWSEEIDHLRAASKIEPSNAKIALALANLYDQHGNFKDASDYCNQVVQLASATPNPLATADQAQAALEILAKEGHVADAQFADTLRALKSTNAREHDKFLAQVDFRNGDQDKYKADVDNLSNDNPTADDISMVADEFTQLGRKDKADEWLKKLDGMELDPGVKAKAMGQHQLRLGNFDEAIKQFKIAVKEAPQKVDAWYAEIQTYLQRGQVDDALNVGKEAVGKLPDDAGIKALLETSGKMAQAPAESESPRILSEVLRHPELKSGALATFDALKDGAKLAPRALADSIRKIAVGNTQLLSVQLLAIRLLREAGDIENAAYVASNATAQFPEDADPAFDAAQCYAQLNRWPEALASAAKWRSRVPASDTLAADLFIAQCDQKIGDLNSAKQVLQKYLPVNPDTAESNGPLIAGYCEVEIQLKDQQAIENFLRPLRDKSVDARVYWILAVRLITDHDQQVKWLKDVESSIPPDDIRGQLAFLEGLHLVNSSISTPQELAARDTAFLQTFSDRATALQMLSVADMQGKDGDNAGAEKSYRRALQLAPGLQIVQNNLAGLLMNTQHLDEALSLANQACSVQSDPYWADFMQTKAQIQDKLSKPKDAIKTLADALKADPKNVDCLVLLAHVQSETNDKNTARKTLKSFEDLNVDPKNLSSETRDLLKVVRAELGTSMVSTNQDQTP